MMKPKLLVIVGPTASGKTNLGIKLAKEKDGAVISADSRQLYTGMNIGTATPQNLADGEIAGQELHDVLTPDVVAGIEHYGFNIRTPDDPITLAEWQQAAFKMIDYVISQGSTPLLVGGTMLYIDSVVNNYDIPAVRPNEKLRKELERESTETLYTKLIKRDAKAKEFIEAKNRRRIIRALEVMETTGRPFSTLRKKREPRYNVEMAGIFPGWEVLRKRIAKRAGQMMEEGLVEETQHLREQYGKDLPLLKTINYKQAAAVLDGAMTRQEAMEEMIKVNMRYARRQMSWWRGRSDIKWATG